MRGYALKGSDGPSRAANNYGQMVSTAFTICAMSDSDHAITSKDSFTLPTGLEA